MDAEAQYAFKDSAVSAPLWATPDLPEQNKVTLTSIYSRELTGNEFTGDIDG